MSKIPWTLFLWPGLPRLWVRGSWFALLLATGSAAALSTALLLSFGFSELVGSGTRTTLWGCVGLFWAVSAAAAFARRGRLLQADRPASASDPYAEALDYYFRGDWFQAERVLVEILKRNQRDIEARLLLATMFRHLRRFDEAACHLDLLVRFDEAAKWEFEIRRERERIDEGGTQALPSEGSLAQDDAVISPGKDSLAA